MLPAGMLVKRHPWESGLRRGLETRELAWGRARGTTRGDSRSLKSLALLSRSLGSPLEQTHDIHSQSPQCQTDWKKSGLGTSV